jgi:hypothetical protein
MKPKFLILFGFVIFLLSACGYKPSINFAKESIGQSVYVEVKFKSDNPKNTVLIKDAMNELIMTKFGSRLVDNEKIADTVIILSLQAFSLSEISFDEEGYVKLYRSRTTIATNYETKSKKKKGSFVTSGFYDFSVDNDSTITDSKTFEAIKSASSKALDEIISKIAITNVK